MEIKYFIDSEDNELFEFHERDKKQVMEWFDFVAKMLHGRNPKRDFRFQLKDGTHVWDYIITINEKEEFLYFIDLNYDWGCSDHDSEVTRQMFYQKLFDHIQSIIESDSYLFKKLRNITFLALPENIANSVVQSCYQHKPAGAIATKQEILKQITIAKQKATLEVEMKKKPRKKPKAEPTEEEDEDDE